MSTDAGRNSAIDSQSSTVLAGLHSAVCPDMGPDAGFRRMADGGGTHISRLVLRSES